MMKIALVIFLLGVMSQAYGHPPAAAFAACSKASAGQQCKFSAPHGTMSGSCQQPPREKQLVCIPGRGPQASRPDQAGGHRTREHTVTQSSGKINTVTANANPVARNSVAISISGQDRLLKSNGISEHATGAFPNQGNPNAIQVQRYEFRIPAEPKLANRVTPLGMHDFGLGVNGVPFDPGAAEWYQGNRGSPWQYEALSGAIALGLDENYAHVQPTGAYHYHGLPRLLLEDLNVSSTRHSPIVGWAADGFPIYALYGYRKAQDTTSGIQELESSYRLKQGNRPSGNGSPGGRYDGTFVADYEFVAGQGDLDQCNGRSGPTPDFPKGTYAYYLTRSFPVIPRCYRGTPSTSFTQQRRR